ncbi:universal stress protein [Actinomadura miaoliensis]|uniref:universal stress protein n=1 Tax=Actinomadura miaoliensis TaxID=430685 RepID=UPI0031E841F9
MTGAKIPLDGSPGSPSVTNMNEIVVGVDGSEHALVAVDWAAEEAHRRAASLRVVHVMVPWPLDIPVDPRVVAVWEGQVNTGEGQQVVDEGLQRARRRVPDLRVAGERSSGQPAATLIEAAENAAMLVVGSRGTGALAEVLLGSVALQVASHARCPAVAVPAVGPEVHGEIVVGVDGSPAGAAAVRFAFEEAELRQARLRAVLAWTHPASTRPGDMQPLVFDPEIVAAEERRLLSESLAGWREKHPDVTVVPEVTRARATRALAAASERADLLIVGSRGRGGFTGLLLGSVGHAMLHRAHCPVAVIRPHTN